MINPEKARQQEILTKNPQPILQRVGEVGWAVLSSWADMVLFLLGIGVLGFSFWYRHAFGNVTFDDGE